MLRVRPQRKPLDRDEATVDDVVERAGCCDEGFLRKLSGRVR
jgi:hypothetical protein